MKHLSLKMEKLEERIAPGGIRFGNHGSKSHQGSKSHNRSRSHRSKSNRSRSH